MAVRQYIGARYVPKFFDNPNGGSGWLSGVEYEPLTIVTYLGDSYTSKKPVPSSVGNPLENSEYWVATGGFNEQMEQYREEVEEVKTELIKTYTKNKNIVVLGDSNAVIFQNSGKLEELCPNATFQKLAVNGAMFRSNDDNNIYSQISRISGVPDIIILWCGSNDIGGSNFANCVDALGEPDVDKIENVPYNISTSFGGARVSITMLRKAYPSAKIIGVIREPKWDRNTEQFMLSEYFFHYLNEMYKVHGIPCVIIGFNSNITRAISESYAYGYTDGVHYSPSEMDYLATMVLTTLATGMNSNGTIDFNAYFPTNYNETSYNNMISKCAWVIKHCYDCNYGSTGWKAFYQKQSYGAMCVQSLHPANKTGKGVIRMPSTNETYLVSDDGVVSSSYNNCVLINSGDIIALNSGDYMFHGSDYANMVNLPTGFIAGSGGYITVRSYPDNTGYKYYKVVPLMETNKEFVRTTDREWKLVGSQI